MDPFTHLYLRVRNIEDATGVARGIHKLVSKTPLEILVETLGEGIEFTYAIPQNVKLRYDGGNNTLHVEVEGGQSPTTRDTASACFKQIVNYVRQTREWGTYEIAPEVGLGGVLGRFFQRGKEAFGFSR